MNRALLFVFLLVGLHVLADFAAAQSVSDEATKHPAAPLEPTRYGLRLTPEIARGMSRLAIQHNLTGELGLSDQQVDALSESSARHLMEMGHAHGQTIGGMVEGFFQSMMATRGRFDPETARAFAERTLPVMPAYNRMLDGFTKDAENILSDDQLASFQDWMSDYREEVQAFEKRMERWQVGGAREGENPFAPSPVAEERGGREKDDPSAARNVQRARSYARWELQRLGPDRWKQYLEHARRFFDFSEDQSARADALLEHYTQRCQEVMTDEWRLRFEKNRVLDRMKWSMRDLSRGPWAYHIDRDYEALVVPIDELGDAFRRDVLGLITVSQRDKALAELRDKAQRHGMEPEIWSEMESMLMSITPAATQAGGQVEDRGS
jgi:hypothetical protein